VTKVVAEEIEEEEHVAAVLAFDCHYGQGYHFAPPLDAASATDLLTLGPYPIGGILNYDTRVENDQEWTGA